MAAGIGGWLAISAHPTNVFVDQQGYHIGNVVMRQDSPGVFDNGGFVVLSAAAGGSQTGSSSMNLNGHHVVGTCTLRSTSEHCDFTTDGVSGLGADDTLTSSGGAESWARTYSDGRTTTIGIPNRVPVPVPVPLDH